MGKKELDQEIRLKGYRPDKNHCDFCKKTISKDDLFLTDRKKAICQECSNLRDYQVCQK